MNRCLQFKTISEFLIPQFLTWGVFVFCFFYAIGLQAQLVSGDPFDMRRSSIGFGGLATFTHVDSPALRENNTTFFSGKSDEDTLIFRGIRFGNSESRFSSDPSAVDSILTESNVAAVVEGPYVYPNPFRLNSVSRAKIYYKLSKNLDIELRVYDMLARLVYKTTFTGGVEGSHGSGLSGDPNIIPVFDDVFLATAQSRLASGVFFYYLMHEGAVLSKGKFVVKP